MTILPVNRYWLCCHQPVVLPAFLHILSGLVHQRFGAFLVALQQHFEARLIVGELLQRDAWIFRVKDQGVLAFVQQSRVIAIERPVAGLYGQFLLFQSLDHIDAMRDTVAVGDDERGAIIRLGIDEGAQGLLIVGSHRHARDVDVTIGHRQHAQVFLGQGLAARREFGDGPARRRFRGLPSCVRVHFGIQHQHVDVAPGGQDMIEAAVADIVGPAIAADNPDALAHQHVRDSEQVARMGRLPLIGKLRALQSPLQDGDARALALDACFAGLIGVEQGIYQLLAYHLNQLLEQFAGVFFLLVQRQAHAETKFGVVFKERIRPRGAAPFGIDAPRRCGQVAAIDGGAAGGIGNDHAIAEQLRRQLDVGRFAAAGTGPGELEERREQLRVLDGGQVEVVAANVRQGEEKLPVGPLLLAQGRLGSHVDRFVLHIALVFNRAGFDAEAAAGAVFGRDLQAVFHAGKLFEVSVHRLEAGRGVFKVYRVKDLHADDRVGADHRAFAALDADARIPGRDLFGDVALLPAGGAGGVGAIGGQGADRQAVAFQGDHRADHVAHESGRLRRYGRSAVQHGQGNRLSPLRARRACRYVGNSGFRAHTLLRVGYRYCDLVQAFQRSVNGLEVALYHRLAALAIRLPDTLFDLIDGLLTRQNAADGEETGLHHRIDARTHTRLVRHFVRVDHVETQFFRQYFLLCLDRQVFPDLLRAIGAIEQEDAAGASIFEDIKAFHKGELVAGNKVGFTGADLIGRVDGMGAETQVRDRHRA